MTEGTGTAGKVMADTLAERGSRYGPWREQSRVTQQIKRALVDTPNWDKLPDYLREAFDQIANKMARTLSGDWAYDDNLHDLVGYAKLAEDCLLQDLANPGSVALPFMIDPDNPPLPWILESLTNMGFDISMPDDGITEAIILDPSKVRDPAFLRDPVRAFLARRQQSD